MTEPKPNPSSDLPVVHQVDARGQQCPGPIMQLKTEIDSLAPGTVLQVLASDPGFASDVVAWCHSTGHKLVGVVPEGKHLRATIQKNGVQHTSPEVEPSGATPKPCALGGALECPPCGAGALTGDPIAPPGSVSLPARGEAPGPLQDQGRCPPRSVTGSLPAGVPAATGQISTKKKTLVVFSGDLDKALAAFIIANGAAAMGSDVTMFFTFWGLNILRRPERVSVTKNLVERMFGWMMPRGATRLALSKMNMGGMGAAMIKGIMRKKNVQSLPELIAAAQKVGVRLIGCTMSMDLMGIKREELIDGIQEGGVAMYLDNAEAGNVNLFI